MANILVAVGSNYTGTQNELSGCVENIRDIANNLQGTFETTLLTEATTLLYPAKVSGLPIKDNILLFWLNAITNAKPGDKVILYYSGHCTQVTDESGTTIDCIVPVDAISKDLSGLRQEKLITSYDLYHLLIQTPENVEMLFIADSCFTGNIIELQNQTKTVALTQVSPFKHLREQLENSPSYSVLHCKITIIAGYKATQSPAALGANAPLTNALITWIKQNGLERFLSDCWTYTENGLAELGQAISVTFKENGLSDQDFQIFYAQNTNDLTNSNSSSLPLSPYLPVQPATWADIWKRIEDLYRIENGNEKLTFSRISNWLLQKYIAHKQAMTLPFENNSTLMNPSMYPLLPEPLYYPFDKEHSTEASDDEQKEQFDDIPLNKEKIDAKLIAEPFNVDDFLGEHQQTLTPTFDNIEKPPSKKTKAPDIDEKRNIKRNFLI